jgi:Flp pilus assembly pilin Flp
MNKNKNGQHLIEYVIIIVVIALAVVVAMKLVRSQINFIFNQVSTKMVTPAAKVEPVK